MPRIVIQTEDFGACVHANASRTEITLKTFDVSNPEIEKFLLEPKQKNCMYASRQIIGVEVIPDEKPPNP